MRVWARVGGIRDIRTGGRAAGRVPGTLRMAAVRVGSASHSNILTETDRRAEGGCGSGEKEGTEAWMEERK